MYKDGWFRLFTNFSEIKNPRRSRGFSIFYFTLNPSHQDLSTQRLSTSRLSRKFQKLENHTLKLVFYIFLILLNYLVLNCKYS